MKTQTSIHQHYDLLRLVAAWIFLNLFINIDYPAPSESWMLLLRPSVEVWAILLGISLLAAGGIRCRALVAWPVIGFLVFGRLFRIGDLLFPLYFNRPFNLYLDTGYVPDLLHLLFHSFSARQLTGYILLSALLSALAIIGIHIALRSAYSVFTQARFRCGFWGLTVVLTLIVSLNHSGTDPEQTDPLITTFTPRVVEEIGFIRQLHEVRTNGIAAIGLTVKNRPPVSDPFAGLNDASVYLFMVESYGHTLLANPRHSSGFIPVIRRFEETLSAAGYRCASNFLDSPTFGGASWLAFGTLESGLRLPDQMTYNFLLNSDLRPLASYFNTAGYRTVSVMPGTTMPWPEGDFFDYRTAYYARNFDYRGPRFGWIPMPDQFVLNDMLRREILPARQPLFIRFVLISSHAPFHRQPPYLADWSKIGDGTIYHRLEPVTFPVNWPDLTNATAAYLRAITYEFSVLGDFLSLLPRQKALIIVMGDHQPNAHITGPNRPGSVPVHVISRDPSLLSPFEKLGYTPGMTPAQPLPHRGMETFLQDFLAAFSP